MLTVWEVVPADMIPLHSFDVTHLGSFTVVVTFDVPPGFKPLQRRKWQFLSLFRRVQTTVL